MNVGQILTELQPEIQGGAPVFLSVYTEEQRYGGPEEGGWWYSHYTYHGSKQFASKKLAEARKKELEDWANKKNEEAAGTRALRTANMPEGNSPYMDTEGYIPQGWGDGGEFAIIIEERAGEYAENQTRPHYE